ncbi:MAG TPA: hypothetical protein VJT67_16985 [Longimicrobiaceae bacterium]|nr:hypothetical protein [Longimicrobiaceae bacterium]
MSTDSQPPSKPPAYRFKRAFKGFLKWALPAFGGAFVGVLATQTNRRIDTITPPCAYPGHYSSADALRWLVQAEGRAVVARDTGMIRKIFSPEATVRDAAVPGVGELALEHYSRLWSGSTFLVIDHNSFGDLSVQGETGRLTTGNLVVYVPPEGPLQTQRNVPRSDHWTFAKTRAGCWVISDFVFNAAHIPLDP